MGGVSAEGEGGSGVGGWTAVGDKVSNVTLK